MMQFVVSIGNYLRHQWISWCLSIILWLILWVGDVSWTQKVQAGKVEIKGAIHELELKPGGDAEWVFVPMKPGKYSLRCPIPGHTEAGMTGEIVIAPQ
jgi:plastocyanin